MKLSWRENSLKFIFLIADAPPHGKKYVVTGNGDRYPNGCPNGLIIEDIAKKINEKFIKFKLLKIGTRTNKMAQIFGDLIKDYEVKDLDSALDFKSNVVNILKKEIIEIDLRKN